MEGELKTGGHVLSATSGTGSNRQTLNYSTDRVVGNGSFGVVFQATCLETGETVSRSPCFRWTAWGSNAVECAVLPDPGTACVCRWPSRKCCRTSGSRTGSCR